MKKWLHKPIVVADMSYTPIRVSCFSAESSLFFVPGKTFRIGRNLVPMTLVDWMKGEWTPHVVRSPSLRISVPDVLIVRDHIMQPKPKFYSDRGVKQRDMWTCQYCGTPVTGKDATIDHVVPKCQGGRKSWANSVTACVSCNSSKAGRTPVEASMRLLTKPVTPLRDGNIFSPGQLQSNPTWAALFSKKT